MAQSTTSARPRSGSSKTSAPDLVQPRFLSIPDEYDPNRTLGPHVAAIATLAGFPPDPEQRLLLDVSFGLDKRGRPLVFESVIIAPRQNLKTGYLKQRALGLMFVLRRQLVVWSAHEFDTSRRALLDLESLIENSPELLRQIALTARGKVASHGAVPEIKTKDGATLAFKTRTAGGGRGLTGDDLFIDEAFAAQSEQMGAVMPIMLARPESQVDFASSACRPESAYLYDLVQRGRAGGGRRMLYAEWCAPPPEEACDDGKACPHTRDAKGCGCDKPEVIVLAHSAVTRGRITLEKVMDLRRTMPADEFPREIMGWHDTPVGAVSPITKESWAAGVDAKSKRGDLLAFAADSTWDGAFTVIAVASLRRDGKTHVEVIDRRRNVLWAVKRLVKLQKWSPVATVIDPASAARPLIALLEAEGIEVMKPSARDAGSACGQLAEAVKEGKIRHLDDRRLNDAIAGASPKDLGEGLWRWTRTSSTVDISPLVAVTNAAWGLAVKANEDYDVLDSIY